MPTDVDKLFDIRVDCLQGLRHDNTSAPCTTTLQNSEVTPGALDVARYSETKPTNDCRIPHVSIQANNDLRRAEGVKRAKPSYRPPTASTRSRYRINLRRRWK